MEQRELDLGRWRSVWGLSCNLCDNTGYIKAFDRVLETCVCAAGDRVRYPLLKVIAK